MPRRKYQRCSGSPSILDFVTLTMTFCYTRNSTPRWTIVSFSDFSTDLASCDNLSELILPTYRASDSKIAFEALIILLLERSWMPL